MLAHRIKLTFVQLAIIELQVGLLSFNLSNRVSQPIATLLEMRLPLLQAPINQGTKVQQFAAQFKTPHLLALHHVDAGTLTSGGQVLRTISVDLGKCLVPFSLEVDA